MTQFEKSVYMAGAIAFALGLGIYWLQKYSRDVPNRPVPP